MPIANGVDSAKPFTLADAPVNKTGAKSPWQHVAHGFLCDRERPERGCVQSVANFDSLQPDRAASNPRAGVVDHHIGAADPRFHHLEELLHLSAVGRVAGKCAYVCLRKQAGQFFGVTGGDGDTHTFPQEIDVRARLQGQAPRQRSVRSNIPMVA